MSLDIYSCAHDSLSLSPPLSRVAWEQKKKKEKEFFCLSLHIVGVFELFIVCDAHCRFPLLRKRRLYSFFFFFFFGSPINFFSPRKRLRRFTYLFQQRQKRQRARSALSGGQTIETHKRVARAKRATARFFFFFTLFLTCTIYTFLEYVCVCAFFLFIN